MNWTSIQLGLSPECGNDPISNQALLEWPLTPDTTLRMAWPLEARGSLFPGKSGAATTKLKIEKGSYDRIFCVLKC